MLAVALEGLENILQVGQQHFLDENGENTFAIVFENEGSLDDLEDLQTNPNQSIYEQAARIIEAYFAED